jgi:RsiW-degrading membrane proteinase PrsW (M82 family)
MQFKQLDIKPLDIKSQGNWFTRTIQSTRFKTTITAIVIGAVLGFLFFYFTEGRLMESMPSKEVLKSLLIGGFFGFFVTNSPCARGRC